MMKCCRVQTNGAFLVNLRLEKVLGSLLCSLKLETSISKWQPSFSLSSLPFGSSQPFSPFSMQLCTRIALSVSLSSSSSVHTQIKALPRFSAFPCFLQHLFRTLFLETKRRKRGGQVLGGQKSAIEVGIFSVAIVFELSGLFLTSFEKLFSRT